MKDKIETELFRNKVFTETKWGKEREIRGEVKTVSIKPKTISKFLLLSENAQASKPDISFHLGQIGLEKPDL